MAHDLREFARIFQPIKLRIDMKVSRLTDKVGIDLGIPEIDVDIPHPPIMTLSLDDLETLSHIHKIQLVGHLVSSLR